MKVFFFALSAIACVFITSCKEFKEATVTGVDSFHVNKINTDGIDADIKLKIKNTNDVGFSIYPSQFDIIYSGMRLGKAKLNKRVHIDANAERVYTFNLKSNLGDLNFMDLTKLLNTANLGKLEIKGDMKVGKFYLKKKFPVNFDDKINLFN